MPYPKRLIEVDLPIKRISVHARKEKSIRSGHISTLHIWWARRPLAACRAVLCASLWLDPSDLLCPEEFVKSVEKEMIKWSDNDHLQLLSKESIEHFIKLNHDRNLVKNRIFLRHLLLDFIADFSNWENSNHQEYLKTTKALTHSAHIALGGEEKTNPLVVDPFAGGGAIPLEALRVGADVFASDLNPIPVLLNKLQLEYIPKHGNKLIEEVRKWGQWIKEEAERELAQYYSGLENPQPEIYLPQVKEYQKKGIKQWKLVKITHEVPITYIWARMIRCEGPTCGAELPLIRSTYLAKRGAASIGLKIIPNIKEKKIEFEIVEGIKEGDTNGTIQKGKARCPVCGFVTASKNVRSQIKQHNGGANNARLIAIVSYLYTSRKSGNTSENMVEVGRFYRLPVSLDYENVSKASSKLDSILSNTNEEVFLSEETPIGGGSGAGRAFSQRNYGMNKFSDLFSKRQLLSIITYIKLCRKVETNSAKDSLGTAAKILLAFQVDKLADLCNALNRWEPIAQCPRQLFARQAISLVWDFAEGVPIANSSGSFSVLFDRMISTLDTLNDYGKTSNGQTEMLDARNHILPDDFCDYFFTDPPYYDAIPYSDLSDFFYVILKRILGKDMPNLFTRELTNKDDELILDDVKKKTTDFFEKGMQSAMKECRRILKPGGIATVVFANKTTKGWEAQLQAMLDAGLVFTASWPIDTENYSRLRAQDSAALASSVHLVCRPRENTDGSLIKDLIGDWRDVQEELPKRIHEWMPRLAEEGVAGADAIFACLGPALEIFSQYSKVVHAGSEREISLREYLEKVWAAVSQEALNMVFSGGDAQGLEEDARLTAMWLWTLTAGTTDADTSGEGDEDMDDDETSSNGKSTVGFSLEYDTARKIAQGLGANLEDLKSLVELRGDKARLLPVRERSYDLFGGSTMQQPPIKKKKKPQLSITFESAEPEEVSKYEMPELKLEDTGKTVLDRLHQAMLLFSTGRTEALKRFLVEDGAGKDDRFWKLAQSLTSLYPKDTEERRWVEAVQTYKKSLGF